MTKIRSVMKWFLNKDCVIPFGLGLLFARFFDSFWSLLAICFFFWSLLFLVEWLLKRKNKSFHFPSKDFLILSVLIFLFMRFIDSFWIFLAIVIPSMCIFFFVKWLLKRKTESEPEKI